MKIDLNSDMGEGFGPYRIGDDSLLIDVLSSANIACGFHAGDPVIMDATVRMAQARGVEIGAHPGLPDLMGFGRRAMAIEAAELERHVTYQIGALMGIAAVAGHRVTHVSYHAALSNMAAADAAVADRLARAIATIDRELILFARPDTEVERAGERAGLRVLTVFLADRGYAADGNLVPRGAADAMVTDPEVVRARVRRFLEGGSVLAADGTVLPVRAQSIAIHSDTVGSVDLGRAARAELEACGVEIAGPAALVA